MPRWPSQKVCREEWERTPWGDHPSEEFGREWEWRPVAAAERGLGPGGCFPRSGDTRCICVRRGRNRRRKGVCLGSEVGAITPLGRWGLRLKPRLVVLA